MTGMALLVGLLLFAVGYWAGRGTSGVAAAGRAGKCPSCGQRRLLWCRGCGRHFDEEDRAMTRAEYDRLTSASSLFEEVPELPEGPSGSAQPRNPKKGNGH